MKRRDFLKGFAVGGASPAALAVSTAMADGAQLEEEITALLHQTEELWNSQNIAGLRDLWDQSDPDPFYLAGEQENWFIGWEAVNDYLIPKPGFKLTEAIRVKFYDIHVRKLSDDLAFAGYWMRTDMKLTVAPKPFGSDNRVCSIFRNKPEGWRYVCYMEGFQAPNLYMQKLFEKDVSPDYQEFYDKLKAKEG